MRNRRSESAAWFSAWTKAAKAWLLVVCLTGPATANDLTLQAEVDAERIGVEDRVQLSITVQGRSLDLQADPALPPISNLRVVGGPFVSTQVSFVNGAITQGRTYTYVFQPRAVGKAEIGAVRVRLRDGTERSASPITIEVVAGSVRPPEPRRADPFGFDPFEDDPFERFFGRRRERAPVAQPKISVRAVASRNRLFVGEPLLLTYFLYSQAQVSDFNFVEPPKYPGFWSEDPETPAGRIRGERATLEGENYLRFPILRKLLFPTKSGTLAIPPAVIKISLPSLGFFDAGPTVVQRVTNAVSVTADSIPDSPNYAGAVGEFRASAALDKTKVSLGEAATLRFRVEGSGNLKWIDQGPGVSVAGAKVYPPQVKSQLRTTNQAIVGSKTWEYVIVPETGGRLEVPALQFPFFDPRNRRTVRSETRRLTLDVASGSGVSAIASAPTGVSAAAPSGALALRADLDRPSRLLLRLNPRALATLLGGVLLAHLLLWSSTRIRLAGLGVRRTAPRMSVRKALSEIGRAGRERMSKEAAAALIEKALLDVFGSLDEATDVGEREHVARAVLEQVRFLRYAPQLGDYSEKIQELVRHASDVVRRWA